MKNLLLTLLALLLSSVMSAGSFVKISHTDRSDLEKIFADHNLTVHYYTDSEVYATAIVFDAKTMVMLDENAFQDTEVYTILYCPAEQQEKHIADHHINALCKTNHAILAKGPAMPFKNDGAVAIFNREAQLPKLTRDFPQVTEVNALIREMQNQVNMDSLQATVQFLQDYQRRLWNSNNAYAASDWIAGKMAALGLEVEQQPFYAYTWFGSGQSAPNVIGIQRGTRYPDTYVVCGSHFDSFSYEAYYSGGTCPGADDNATGVASVLESARIMTQYEFEYSIVYCAYGCEEMGLYGSEAYASRCQQQGMDIIGYFNNDMNGYLYGDVIHIDCIYPNSVAPIGDYYINVANIYFPEMPVRHVDLTYGDSDHTSFNNHGYMGIYPFEDVDHDSPYIHSENDLIGPSVNSFGMSQRYCQMNIACLAEIANPVGEPPVVECNPVVNFHLDFPEVSKEMSSITLKWEEPLPGSTGLCTSYEVYRDGNLIATLINETDTDFEYRDTLSVGVYAEYMVTAVYDDGCKAASESLEAVGVPDGVNETSNVKAEIFPNPVENELTVKAEGLLRVIIYDLMGQQITSTETKCDEQSISMDDYPKGIYFIQLVTNKGTLTRNIILK